MTCPICKIENQPSAKRCDCGHAFGDGRPPLSKMEAETLPANVRAVWILPMLGTLYGGSDLFTSWSVQMSAPQQAALAAYSLAWAVIPYCFARAFAGIFGR